MKVAVSVRELKASNGLMLRVMKTAGIVVPAEEVAMLQEGSIYELAKLLNETTEPGVSVNVVVIDNEDYLVIEHSEKTILAVFETIDKHYDRIVPLIVAFVNLAKTLKFVTGDFMRDMKQALEKALAE